MADTELTQNAELLDRVNRELETFGRLLPSTANDLKDAQTGVKNFNLKVGLATNALGSLAGAVGSYTKEMYAGTQGARAFSKSLDNLGSAVQAASAGLALLVPGGVAIKGVVAGLGYLAGELIKTANVAGEQGDALYKAFQGIAQSGAAAGDGMQGVFDSMQKLGMGVQDAEKFISLLSNNADTLMQYGGTVAQGRKQFETTVAEMKPFRDQIRALGLDQEAQNEAAIAYTKIQNRLNLETKNNQAVSGAAAAQYIKEMDQLTKVTGITRKQQEEALDEAMRNQRFAATIDALQAEGRTKEARQLQVAFQMARAAGKDAGDAFADTAAGFIDSAAAQKGAISSNNEYAAVIDRIKNGQVKDNNELSSNVQGLFKSVGDVTKSMRSTYQLGVGEDFMLSYATGAKMIKMSSNDFSKAFEEAGNQIDAQMGANGKKQDELLTDAVKMRNAQQDAMLDEQATVQLAVKAITKDLAKTAEAHQKVTAQALKAAKALGKLADDGDEALDAQDDLNRAQMTFGEKLESYSAGAVETIGKVLGAGVGVVSDTAGGAITNVAKNATKQRRQNETAYLQGQGRFMEALPQQSSGNLGATPGLNAGASAGQQQVNYEDYIQFTGGTGDKGHFDQLAGPVKEAFIQMARDYNQVTGGKKLQINSSFRSPDEQSRVDSGGNPKAAPGMSYHNYGRALDINSEQRSLLERSGLLSTYGFKALEGDPPHIYMKDGGVVPARPGGSHVIAGEAGRDEAFIPLRDGKVPVTLNMSDFGSGFANISKYSGYDLGGSPGLLDIATQIKEVVSNNKSGFEDAVKSMSAELKVSIDNLNRNLEKAGTDNSSLQRMVSLLENLERQQTRTAAAQERMAQIAAN